MPFFPSNTNNGDYLASTGGTVTGTINLTGTGVGIANESALIDPGKLVLLGGSKAVEKITVVTPILNFYQTGTYQLMSISASTIFLFTGVDIYCTAGSAALTGSISIGDSVLGNDFYSAGLTMPLEMGEFIPFTISQSTNTYADSGTTVTYSITNAAMSNNLQGFINFHGLVMPNTL